MDFRVMMLLQALNQIKEPKVELSHEQWNQCLQFAAEHGLECVFFDYYQLFFPDDFKQSDIYQKWQGKIIHRLFWTKQSERRAREVLAQLEKQGVFAIVLKGIDCASYYIKPENRTMSDMDIFLHWDDLEQADKVFQSLDYIHAQDQDTDKEYIYYPKEEGYFFEVHFALFKKELSDYTQAFGYNALQTAVRSKDGEFNVLEPTLATAYMLVHMVKHLYGTGIGLKGLYDLALYVRAQKGHIDEQKLKLYLTKFHMLKTGAYILACANRFLASGFVLDYEIQDAFCNNLFGIIARSGDTGMREEYVIEQRYEVLAQGPYKGKKDKMHLLTFVFLPLDQMKKRYSSLNKHSWLLPVFWGVRIVRVVFKSRQNLKKWIRRDINHRNIMTHQETITFLKEE